VQLLECFGQEEMADRGLYQLAKAGFLGLAVNAGPLMGRALEIRLIEQQGIRPDLAQCCRCGQALGKEKSGFFSPREGGFLCGSCAKEVQGITRVSPAAAALWQSLENLALDKLNRVSVSDGQLDELGKVLNQWILRHTGRPMKTLTMLNNKLEG
jgi:DNA repair protein RecO (recombination protein O)